MRGLLALLLAGQAASPDAGVRVLEVSIAQAPESVKGSVWPGPGKSGKRPQLHSVDGRSELIVHFPGGRSWRGQALHSVSYSLDESGGTVRGVAIVFDRTPGDWPTTVARALQLAEELGAPVEQRERWGKRLLATPARGSNRVFPSFPLEGCIAATTTITPSRAYEPRHVVDSWTVSLELSVLTPQVWSVNQTWPKTCP